MSNPALFNRNLLVYRASAGSGKTHRLTGELLRLLFSSPYAYRRILAVTFTNKATDEMKSRIIEELANLSSGKESGYLAELVLEFGRPEHKMREEARNALINILHDYSAFSISTIDRFFQQTMRAFTREIGIGGGYVIELDSSRVLREAVDSLLFDLERRENKQLLEWLIRFSEEKIMNGETWNIRNDILSLSTEIFKESYKAFGDKLNTDISDKEFLGEYKKILEEIIRDFEKRSRAVADKAMNCMGLSGLKPDDFKGGARSPFFQFVKWRSGETKEPTASFIKLADDVANWYTAKISQEKKTKIEECFHNGLNDCINEICHHYRNILFYQTAVEINRFYFTLGILNDVETKIREITADNNILLISDTTELLTKIIQGTDSSFIYEKAGTYIDHYMIDEFQDTSGMQWENFRPLISDSIASGNRNLIVGDIKQSIYRWRNSDWKLLEEQLELDFGKSSIDNQSLNVNWRSLPNIVDFNNAVFSASSIILQADFNSSLPDLPEQEWVMQFSKKIETAYKGVYQQLPRMSGIGNGHVRVEFINEDEEDWKLYSLSRLPGTIESLQDKGYRPGDIAILVRTKKEGADVAACLLDYKSKNPSSCYKYDIISDEALFINNAQSIKLIISILKYLNNPVDPALKTLAQYEYSKIEYGLSTEDALQKHFSVSSGFPENINSYIQNISRLPLYEMVENIFELFKSAFGKNENIYIQSFLDMVLDFTVKQSADLDAFLQWWNETGSAKTIFTPDGQNAIRIMTIHKSKGLGFKTVILPFCNWDLDHKLTTILWCRPQLPPFDKLNLVPVRYSPRLKNTIFSYEYYKERLHTFIDNLNVLYVAFTRAKEELIAFMPRPQKDNLSNISSLLWKTVNTEDLLDEDRFMDLKGNLTEDNILEIGKGFLPYHKEKNRNGNEFASEEIVSIPFDNRLNLKLNNKYFFSGSGKREYGALIHEIVSNIELSESLEQVIESYVISGDLTKKEKTEIYDMLYHFLSKEQVSEWYSGKYKVLNEVQILQPDGTFIRPDRVMIKGNTVIVIDYKFGNKKEQKYNRQVKYYMSQIRKMGYENISGYICYIALDKIEEVI